MSGCVCRDGYTSQGQRKYVVTNAGYARVIVIDMGQYWDVVTTKTWGCSMLPRIVLTNATGDLS